VHEIRDTIGVIRKITDTQKQIELLEAFRNIFANASYEEDGNIPNIAAFLMKFNELSSTRADLYNGIEAVTGFYQSGKLAELVSKLACSEGGQEKLQALINRINNQIVQLQNPGTSREDLGRALLKQKDANGFGSDRGYFTKQYGWYGNKYLYIKFDPEQNKWLVNLGCTNEWHDPANYSVSMWGGSDSYNQLIRELAEINER
jgi:hypothetical protein